MTTGNPEQHERLVTEIASGVSVDDSGFDPVFSVRPKATLNGRDNDVNVQIRKVQIFNTGSEDLRFKSQKNGDASGTYDKAEYTNAPSDFQNAIEVEKTTANITATYLSGAPVPPAGLVFSGKGNSPGGSAQESPNFTLAPSESFTIFANALANSTTIDIYVTVVQFL